MTSTAPLRNPIILMPPAVPSSSNSDPRLTALIGELEGRAIQAVEEAGGHVVVFEPEKWSMEAAFDNSHGLLLPGGGDVEPSLYGDASRHPELYNVNEEADRAAIAMAREAERRGLPVLAVCRGMHILNVAHGGTLVQHMQPSSVVHRGGSETPMVEHKVSLDPGSRSAGIFDRTELTVRSGHHQSVDRLGRGLKVVGRADDGVVEAIEVDGRPVVGIQWHPEETQAETSDKRALFGWLVDAARSNAVAAPLSKTQFDDKGEYPEKFTRDDQLKHNQSAE